MGSIARNFCVFFPCFVGLGAVDSIWMVAGGHFGAEEDQ
jgi:hypothetical protein